MGRWGWCRWISLGLLCRQCHSELCLHRGCGWCGGGVGLCRTGHLRRRHHGIWVDRLWRRGGVAGAMPIATTRAVPAEVGGGGGLCDRGWNPQRQWQPRHIGTRPCRGQSNQGFESVVGRGRRWWGGFCGRGWSGHNGRHRGGWRALQFVGLECVLLCGRRRRRVLYLWHSLWIRGKQWVRHRGWERRWERRA